MIIGSIAVIFAFLIHLFTLTISIKNDRKLLLTKTVMFFLFADLLLLTLVAFTSYIIFNPLQFFIN